MWSQRLALLTLAPLLLAQGRHVRAVTPRLAEPSGDRGGRVGSGPRLRLLIAGDSAAAGVGVEQQRAALAGQLVQRLSAQFDTQWQLVAQTGFTTADLLQRLAQEPVSQFDVAVISLGVNDVTDGVLASTWLRRQRALTELLRRRFGVQHVVLSSLPPMQAMPALPQPLRWALGVRARRFNRALLRTSSNWPACEVLELQINDEPGALAADGFHPGWRTYELWAQALVERIVPPRLAQPARQ